MAGLPLLPLRDSMDSRVGRQFLLALRINFVDVDSTLGPQTVKLAQQQGPMVVVKDIGGAASGNTITVQGVVEGVTDPTIATDYGVLRFIALDGVWHTW